MKHELDVRARCFAPTASLRAGGLRAFVQVTIDENVFVDGLAVRVTAGGKALVTWPERRDGEGRAHAVVRILDEETRGEIERAVLAEAVRGGWLEQGRIPPAGGRTTP